MITKHTSPFISRFNICRISAVPILYVSTPEERRVEEDIVYAINVVGSEGGDPEHIYQWSCTEGLVQHKPDLKVIDASAQMKNPDNVLQYMMTLKDNESENKIFILRDFHHYIQPGNCSPFILRMLKDLFHKFKARGSMIVMIAPCKNIPLDIEREVEVYDYELPGKEDFKKILFEVMISYLGSIDEHKYNDKKINQMRSSMDYYELGKETFNVDAEYMDQVLDSVLGMTLCEAESAAVKSAVEHKTFLPKAITSHKAQLIKKSGVLEWIDATTDMTKVGGLHNLKDWIKLRTLAFTKEAQDKNIPAPRGIIIVGISGTGKSLVGKSIANILGIPLLRFDIGAVFGSLVGESERNMRFALNTVEAIGTAVLWIDEVEKAFGGVGDLDGGTSRRVFGNFLTWMQERTKPIFVVATANDISALPPEFIRRGGRFDEIFFVDLPNLGERKEIWRIHLSPITWLDKNIDVEKLAQVTDGFSGAEIRSMVENSMYLAFSEKSNITMKHLATSIKECIPLSKTMEDRIDALRKWGAVNAKLASKDVVALDEPAAIAQSSGVKIKKISKNNNDDK